jgi:hypothetical protein
MDMVKLQILLKRSMRPDELDRVEELLTAMGTIVTGRGAVTLSATMPSDSFEKVFLKQHVGRSGFAADLGTASALPVPTGLEEYIESISETPPHQRM